MPLLLISLVIASLPGLGLLNNNHLVAVLLFIVSLAVLGLLLFIKGMGQPTTDLTVKAGVLSVIVIDATAVTSFGSLPYGLLVLSLLQISKLFA